MSDLTEIQGSLSVKVAGANPATGAEDNYLEVDSNGLIGIRLYDASGTALTSQANGLQRALDVGINVGGVQIDPRSIRALTSADVVTANQGTSPWVVSGTVTAAEDKNYGTVGASTLRTASQIGNATGAAAFNAGTTTAQTLRVVLPTDQTAIPATQSGTWTTGRTWTLASGTDSVSAVQSTSPWITKDQSDGPVTPGTVASFSQLAGGQFNTSLPTLTTGQQAALQVDSSGRLIISPATTTITGTVAVSNFPSTVDTNYGTVGANTIRTASQIGNATGAAAFNAGTTTAQTLRVVLPTDQTSIPAAQSGTWTVQPGNTANTTPWLVTDSSDGPVTPGTVAGKSSLAGGQYNSTPPTLTNGQQVALQLDSAGRLLVDANIVDTRDTNYGTVGANTLRSASQIGNATGAADFAAGNSSAQTLRVVVASNQVAIPVTQSTSPWVISGTVTVSNFPSTVDTNYGTVGASTIRTAAQIGNATGAAAFNAGTTTAQTLRVVLPTDQTAIPASQSGTWTTGRTWTLASGTDSVSVVQSTSPWVTKDQSDGPVTPGTVASFSQLAGGQFNTALPTLTTGQQAALQVDSSGRLIISPATQTVTGTVAVSNFPSTVDTNYGTVGANTIRVASQIGNATGAAAFNAGTTTAQTLRVVLPTDQTAIPVSQSGTWTTGRTWTLASGTDSVSAVQSGTWTVQPGNTANTTPWLVTDSSDGPVTPGTVAAKSSLAGGQFNTSLPTLTTGQQAALQVDSSGRLIISPATQTVTGTVAVSNFPSTVDTNFGTVGANTLRSAAQIGNATGAADFNAGNSSAQTLRVVVATNQAAIPVSQSGTWTVQPGNTQNTTAWLTQDAADGPVTPGTVATKSILIGGQFNTALPTLTNGQQSAIQVDSSGRLLISGTLSAGVADKTTFTYGTTVFQNSGGVFQDTSPTLTAGQEGIVRLTSNRAFHVNLRDSSGNEKLGSSTSANSIPVVIASDQAAIPVSQSGTWTVQQGTPPWSVAGNVASAATDSGNPVKVGAVFNTTLPTFTTGQRGDLQIDSRGRLITTISNFPTTLDTNYGTVGASTLRTASQVGNATGAADFNAGATGAQTLRVVANQGAPNTNANGWFARLTDGTDNVSVTTNGDLSTSDGLTNGGTYGNLVLTTAGTTYEAKVGASRLANRKSLTVIAFDNDMFWGYDSSVTTSTGTPLYRGQMIRFSIDPDTTFQIWLVCAASSKNARITESP